MSNNDRSEDSDTSADAESADESPSDDLFVRPETDDDPDSDPVTGPQESEPEPFSQLEGETALSEVDADYPHDEDAFEKIDISDIDPETVWDTLGSESQSKLGGESRQVDPDTTVEHVVDKGEYCQDCPYFGEPPETACTHEGTEIVSVVDPDRFRVRDCPMIDPEDETIDRNI